MKKKMRTEKISEVIKKPSGETIEVYLEYLSSVHNDLIRRLDAKGCTNLKITLDTDYFYFPYSCGEEETRLLMKGQGQRLETDKEIERRRKRAESSKKAAETRKKEREKREKSTLKKLMKKYPEVMDG